MYIHNLYGMQTHVSLSATNTLLYTCRAHHEFAYNSTVYTFTHTAHMCILLHSTSLCIQLHRVHVLKVHTESEM